jgi:hypothetical protein
MLRARTISATVGVLLLNAGAFVAPIMAAAGALLMAPAMIAAFVNLAD